MFVDNNPDASLDDVLAHYGVLGMKWGQHRVKADSYDIHTARRRLLVKRDQLDAAKSSVGKARNPQQKAAAKAKVSHLKSSFLKNPDRVTAARLTRGEKALSILLLTPVGAAAIIGGTSAVSRRIERKQELGKYN